MSEKRKRSTQQTLEHFVFKSRKAEHTAVEEEQSNSRNNNDCQSSINNNNEVEVTLDEFEQIQKNENTLPKLVEQPMFFEDISCYVKKSILTDNDRINVLKNVWKPDKNYTFPVSSSGGESSKPKNRKFCYSWLEKHRWLTYSKIEDAAYCKYCAIFAPHQVGSRSAQATGSLVIEGFKNWKKALEKFVQHEVSSYHKSSILKGEEFLNIVEKRSTSVNHMLDKEKDKQIKQNREILKPIIKTVVFCGRQGISLRGHRDFGEVNIISESNKNEGNFRALLQFRVDAGDQILTNHLNNCAKNAMYTSWGIQNEIITACHEVIVKQIVNEISEVKCFAVLADETADISNKEEMTLCVRYLKSFETNNINCHELKVVEHFLKFIPLSGTTGLEIANAIIKGLSDCKIDLSFLYGQGYDGAPAMSGDTNGAQEIIQKQYPKALYVHCAAHCLNLAISKSANISAIKSCFATIYNVYKFFDTPKRSLILEHYINKTNQENERKKSKKLKKTCPTRWVERHDAVSVMVLLFDEVVESLEEISTWKDPKASADAHNLLCCIIKSEFIISLFSAEKLLAYTLQLSKKLQEVNLDLLSAIDNVNDIVNVVSNIRDNVDKEFGEIFEKAAKILNQNGETVTLPRIIKKQGFRSGFETQDPQQHYKVSIFIPWVDHFVTHLNDKFLKHKQLLQTFSSIIPNKKQPSEEDQEKFLDLVKKYLDNTEPKTEILLQAELNLWYMKIFTKGLNIQSPIELINLCDEDSLPTVFQLLKIYATIPVSTSSAERSFSTLKRLKTYLRNSMGETRLNGLAALNIHREIMIDPDQVIDILSTKNRRLNFVL